MNIVLIGFRGTGKTTLGKALAEKLNRPFLDTDALICEQTGLSIPNIFSSIGEKGFRNIESEIIQKIQTKEDAIISCGGGAILDPENIKHLKKNGFLVLLTATAETIEQRIRGSLERPSLTEKEPLEEIRHLLEIRNPLYRKVADLVIDTESKTPEELIQQLETL